MPFKKESKSPGKGYLLHLAMDVNGFAISGCIAEIIMRRKESWAVVCRNCFLGYNSSVSSLITPQGLYL